MLLFLLLSHTPGPRSLSPEAQIRHGEAQLSLQGEWCEGRNKWVSAVGRIKPQGHPWASPQTRGCGRVVEKGQYGDDGVRLARLLTLSSGPHPGLSWWGNAVVASSPVDEGGRRGGKSEEV